MAEDDRWMNTKKQKAVRVWLDDEENHLWTDGHIAAQCGVSVALVSASRLANTKFVHVTRRKRLNADGEVRWINTRYKGKTRPTPLVKGKELNPLLSGLKTDLSALITHTDASIMVVCAAEEFLEVLNAYIPDDKSHEYVDAWDDTNGAHEPL